MRWMVFCFLVVIGLGYQGTANAQEGGLVHRGFGDAMPLAMSFSGAGSVWSMGGMRVRSSPFAVEKSGGLGGGTVVPRQAIYADALVPAIPVLLIDFVPLLGNVIALSAGMGQITWGITGLAFSAVGVLLMIPSFGNLIMSLALGLLQTVLFGLSLANLLIGLQQAKRAREAAAQASLQKLLPQDIGRGLRPLGLSF